MSRTYRRSKRDAKHSYYYDKAEENYYTKSEYMMFYGLRFRNNPRQEKIWWEESRKKYHRDGTTRSVGTWCNCNKKGLKEQTRRTRRRDEQYFVNKYMKGETDDIPNLEKKYLGFIWNWD